MERGTGVAPEAVGQEERDARESERRERAGSGFPGWVRTGIGIFSVVVVLFAIFLVAILVAS
jgi:hypothetical protein